MSSISGWNYDINNKLTRVAKEHKWFIGIGKETPKEFKASETQKVTIGHTRSGSAASIVLRTSGGEPVISICHPEDRVVASYGIMGQGLFPGPDYQTVFSNNVPMPVSSEFEAFLEDIKGFLDGIPALAKQERYGLAIRPMLVAYIEILRGLRAPRDRGAQVQQQEATGTGGIAMASMAVNITPPLEPGSIFTHTIRPAR